MKETDIFRKALLALNIDYNKIMAEKLAYDALTDEEKESKEDPGVPIEVRYCEEFLESSENYCAAMRPWYWLLEKQEYTDVDRQVAYTTIVGGLEQKVYESYRKCDYCYLAPDDMLYPYIVNGEYNFAYERMGDYIYFKEAVDDMFYISENGKRTKDGEKVYVTIAPDIYFSLIAARLALEIAPFIAPDTTVEQRATQQFQLTLQALLKIEEHSRRERNADPKEFIL